MFSFKYSAYFTNTEFTGFRQQFNSLIYSEHSLNFTNVNFTRNQARAGRSVIILNCGSNCQKSDFSYIGGIVTDTNYGYEHSEFIEVGSFFSSSNSNSLQFEAISFTYNFVLSNQQFRYPAFLIGIKDTSGTILIANCNFHANYANQIIIVDQSKLLYADLNPNSLNISQAYSQTHFTLKNTSFTSIYTSMSCISYIMSGIVHNLNLISVNVSKVYSTNEVINIYNSEKLQVQDILGEYISETINDIYYNVFIPPRIISIDRL